MAANLRIVPFLCLGCLAVARKESCDAVGSSQRSRSQIKDTVSLLQVHIQASQRQKDIDAAGGGATEGCTPNCIPNCPSYCARQKEIDSAVPVEIVPAAVPAVVPAATPAVVPAAVPVVYQPEHKKCTPQCTYKCDTPKFDEVCAPVCDPPKCQTRCTGFNTKQCVMACGEPNCAVVCLKNGCPTGRCPACQTKCGTPMCNMKCKGGKQPCQNICEQPRCKWKCKAPVDGPKPTCTMACEKPTDCMGDTYKQMPALQPGECAVESSTAAVNLMQAGDGNSTMRVQISFLEAGAAPEVKEIELPIVSSTAQ